MDRFRTMTVSSRKKIISLFEAELLKQIVSA
jgi:hypothetical protein